jgi:hypothetical protein
MSLLQDSNKFRQLSLAQAVVLGDFDARLEPDLRVAVR